MPRGPASAPVMRSRTAAPMRFSGLRRRRRSFRRTTERATMQNGSLPVDAGCRLGAPLMSERYDYLIVGAGAAGCAIAARLSEQRDQSVLLLEAGADIAPGAEPADVLDVYPASYYNTSYFWPELKAWWRTAADAAPSTFSQARIVGGGGSVMGMVALRG